jgi:hypothetical protein
MHFRGQIDSPSASSVLVMLQINDRHIISINALRQVISHVYSRSIGTDQRTDDFITTLQIVLQSGHGYSLSRV